MKKDLPKIIRQVSQFLNRNLSEEQIKLLTKHVSFETMKNNPAVNYEMVMEMNKKFKIIEHEGAFIRAGGEGKNKEELSSEKLKILEEWTRQNLKGTGYVL